MNKIILILGGARSGKSTYAINLAKKHKRIAFIATCQPLDKEMQHRIRIHQQTRPKNWKTFEEPKDLDSLLLRMNKTFDCIIIDCMTLLVSNLILGGYKETDIFKKIRKMLINLKKKQAKVILVSNEVGLGLVPTNKLGRQFRDIAGKVNQLVARVADEVFFVIAGIPTRIKAEE